jgi:excisionase family DNA binding protein
MVDLGHEARNFEVRFEDELVNNRRTPTLHPDVVRTAQLLAQIRARIIFESAGEEPALSTAPGPKATSDPQPARAPTALLLRIGEVATALAVSRTTAYELVRSGEIPSLTIGRSRRVSVEGLQTWIRRQEQGT